MKNAFATYHPVVNAVYFMFMLIFSMCFMHPICLGISLCVSFCYAMILKREKALKMGVYLFIPMLLLGALINPAFNHEGVTILLYLPSGNPLTLESIVYGVAGATMIASVFCWFVCYNEVMTSDKFIYLFGKAIPALSLILSMIFRFVPRFLAQAKTVTMVQKSMGKDITKGSLISRAKIGITILSILVTWSLENAIETADSMKSRGYGLPNRTAFSIFIWEKRDAKAIICIMLLGIYIAVGSFLDGLYYRYFPTIKGNGWSGWTISLLVAYLILCVIPIYIERREARRWQLTR